MTSAIVTRVGSPLNIHTDGDVVIKEESDSLPKVNQRRTRTLIKSDSEIEQEEKK